MTKKGMAVFERRKRKRVNSARRGEAGAAESDEVMALLMESLSQR